jgi:hypothetical protein
MSSDRLDTGGSSDPSVDDSSTESTETGEGDREPIPKDDQFAILKNRRRRDILKYLREHDGKSTLSDLAEFVAAKENDIDESLLSSDERKRVYIGLYQCHLPQMDDTRVVDFEKRSGDVILRPEAEQLMKYLEDEESEAEVDEGRESEAEIDERRESEAEVDERRESEAEVDADATTTEGSDVETPPETASETTRDDEESSDSESESPTVHDLNGDPETDGRSSSPDDHELNGDPETNGRSNSPDDHELNGEPETNGRSDSSEDHELNGEPGTNGRSDSSDRRELKGEPETDERPGGTVDNNRSVPSESESESESEDRSDSAAVRDRTEAGGNDAIAGSPTEAGGPTTRDPGASGHSSGPAASRAAHASDEESSSPNRGRPHQPEQATRGEGHLLPASAKAGLGGVLCVVVSIAVVGAPTLAPPDLLGLAGLGLMTVVEAIDSLGSGVGVKS